MARRRSDVIWRPVDGRVVGLDLQTSRYFSLNASGTALWDLLAGDVTESQMADVLVERFGIDRQAAEADVELFLADMGENGLLEE